VRQISTFLIVVFLATACSGDGDSARSPDANAPTRAIETAGVASPTPTTAMTTPTAGTSTVGIPTTGSTGAVATPTASAANEVREAASPAPGLINVWVYGDAQVQSGRCVTFISQMIPDSAPQSIGGRAATCEYSGVDVGRLRFTKSRDGVLHLANVQLLLLASKTLPKELQVRPVSCLELKQYLLPASAPASDPYYLSCSYVPAFRGQYTQKAGPFWGVQAVDPSRDQTREVNCVDLVPFVAREGEPVANTPCSREIPQ